LGLFITMIGANIANLKLMPSALSVTIVPLILMSYLLWAGPGAYAVDNCQAPGPGRSRASADGSSLRLRSCCT
jgi:hypothetical protein